MPRSILSFCNRLPNPMEGLLRLRMPTIDKAKSNVSLVAVTTVVIILTLLILWVCFSKPNEFYEVIPVRVDSSVQLRGAISSADSVPIVASTFGHILDIIDSGKIVKEGDIICEVSSYFAEEKVRGFTAKIKSLELELELLRKEFEVVRFREEENIRVLIAELQHAQLVETTELAIPTEEDVRFLEIQRQLSVLDVEEKSYEYLNQNRLYEKDIVAESTLQRFRRRLEIAEARLKETELEVEIRNKGITPQRRVELRTAVEQAEAALERTETQKDKKLAELKLNIRAQEKKILVHDYNRKRFELEIQNAKIRAPRAGVFKVRRYIDWRSGGIQIEFNTGAELELYDIIGHIMDPEMMKVELAVNEADFRYLKPGMPAHIRLPAFPDLLFHGELEHLGAIGQDRNEFDQSATGKSDVVMFNAEIKFSNIGRDIHPGMSAIVSVITEPMSIRLVVPLESVFMENERFFVMRKTFWGLKKTEFNGRYFNEHYFLVSNGIVEGDHILRNYKRDSE